ncbi:hypothetical protein [Pseudomonas mosselii]
MPFSADHNYGLLELVAQRLGEDLLDEVAFVGGCTTAMLVTDPVIINDIRYTEDVDLVIELAGIVQWTRLTERLAAKNIKITGEDDVNCRFRFNDVIVDVMPTAAEVLGYTNRWFVEGLAHSATQPLPSGLEIRIFRAPYFLATKLEAFKGRGKNDPYHKDVEDILIVIDGRPELLQELKAAKDELRQYIAAGITELLRLDGIDYAVQSSNSVRSAPGRESLIFQRLHELAALK